MQLNFSADIIAIAGPVKAKSLRAGASPAEAAMYRIERLGYRLLLTLPEGLRRRLFIDSTLSGNCTFILARLYSLDSRGVLDHHVQELPRQTGLALERMPGLPANPCPIGWNRVYRGRCATQGQAFGRTSNLRTANGFYAET